MTGRAGQGLPPLLPTPKRVVRRRGSFPLREAPPIVLAPDSRDDDFSTALALRDAVLAACDVSLAVETHFRRDDLSPAILLEREGDEGEAYRLSVAPDRVLLSGAGPAGLRYAVETLAQLVDARARLPACEIEDAPDLRLRGLMLDVSRGKVPTLATLKQLVDVCVRLKLNVLMLYVEHTFPFRRHPEIGADASPLEAATLRELDGYAAARHVQLIPSLQSLGHMDHVLELPRYRELAETERNWTLSPALEGTYDLLSDLYDEFLPNFRSRLFNANCDETFDLGLGKAADLLQELGHGGPFLYHVRRLRELARGHGKRLMIWADMAHARPERLHEFDRDVVFLDWWYEAEFDFDRVKRFGEHGFDFLVCPGTSSWNCLFPRIENSLTNVQRWAEAGKRHGALGLLMTDWGDFGHYNLQGNSWLGYAWAAEQAWSGAAEPRGFDRAFSRLFFADGTGEAARIYRELGAVHDAGFQVFNASPLQLLFFDDLDEAFFVRGAKAGALRRSRRRLAMVRARLEAGRERQAGDPSWEELVYAADASLFALEKALSGLAFVAWRRRPERLDARGRRRLARALAGHADAQAALAARLQRLWLARSRPSDFALTRRRIRRSIRSLRAASRALERNQPPAAPGPHPGFDPGSAMRAVYASLAG